jgi:hypothetical protein
MMVRPKEAPAAFREARRKYFVPLGSFELISGSELIVKYDLNECGHARIILNRDLMENRVRLKALADDIISRLAERMMPDVLSENRSHFFEYDEQVA